MATRTKTARIVEWNAEKGFGYLNASGRRLFVHIRDFTVRHKKPEVGDVIRFSLGEDRKGRKCAVNAIHANEGGKISVWNFFSLVGLMFLPALAAASLGINGILIGGYGLTVAFVTFMLYAHDKSRAREGQSRISESMLHFFELIGGWPGAFLAQRRLRHKCSKARHKAVMWLIILGYQFVALDFLHHWRLSSAALKPVVAAVNHLQQ